MQGFLNRIEKAFWKRMTNVHSEMACAGRPCPVHLPSKHHMRQWPLNWRDDRGILERICEHGIGHPDPDQREYWNETGQEWQGTHGCDGCCSDQYNPYHSID